jgi:hypothetical protein
VVVRQRMPHDTARSLIAAGESERMRGHAGGERRFLSHNFLLAGLLAAFLAAALCLLHADTLLCTPNATTRPD